MPQPSDVHAELAGLVAELAGFLADHVAAPESIAVLASIEERARALIPPEVEPDSRCPCGYPDWRAAHSCDRSLG